MPASTQRGSGASLEGYIGMQESINAPNTLPVSMMLPVDVSNLLVPVAVRASHVAFSSVRLEPTWMCLGDAVRQDSCSIIFLERGPTHTNMHALSLVLCIFACMIYIYNFEFGGDNLPVPTTRMHTHGATGGKISEYCFAAATRRSIDRAIG